MMISYILATMRTLIDIEASQIEKLDHLAARQKRSRAALVREAVSNYLEQQSPSGFEESRGLWRDLDVDGLEYQRRLREEW